jgi:2-phospho-L-lactate/phosphoenolpyruvate guanylyltransferase
MSSDRDRWSLLVPVKRLEIAKTRLALADRPRADLALAMACDTVASALAAVAVAEVVVITDDARAAAVLSRLGARVVGDLPNAGLNPALVHGASVAAMPRVAALSSDLPALRSADVDAVLRLAATHPCAVVADVAGTGTTLLSATAIAAFAPAFGVDSRAAHVSAGAVDLSAEAAASVRHDVDTLDALRATLDLGVGPETTRALAALDVDSLLG